MNHRFLNRLRWPGALLIGLLALGGALGLTLWLLFDPPFLTWQHADELSPALAAYAAERLPGLEAPRVERVRAYSATCSVVRASAPRQDGRPFRFWALLHRGDATWQVFQTLPEGRLAPLMAWGDLCAEDARPLPPRDLLPLP
ncbi:MAG: hypothetical protein JXN59_16770 [Anaerolineae bacterium]|nr:hypothetical protein [Anaerolineae bacterium]